MLPAHERLRRPSAFDRIYQSGRAFGDALLVLHVHPSLDRPGSSRVGFVAGKKVGNAVVRNRVKRRLRELVRARQRYWEPPVDLILRARPGASEASFADLGRSLDRLLRKAGLAGSYAPESAT